MYELFGQHADVVLYQTEIPWEDFRDSSETNSNKINELQEQIELGSRRGLGYIFVIDPLNGLNRREFNNLPEDWEASFANPDVRSAFTNFTLRIVQEFHPAYLGLASEINTYADAHPDDFEHYLTLYREVYAAVKEISPETSIFVTFQWEDLNNLWAQPEESDFVQGEIKWQLIEAFEPELDLWVISSYPYIAFSSSEDIPPDYYSPLLEHTDKTLAVAEGGWISEDYLQLQASPEDQVNYLNAIHDQIGSRLTFWIYLLMQDINVDDYARFIPKKDLATLRFFETVGLISPDGTAKPALKTWDSYRSGE